MPELTPRSRTLTRILGVLLALTLPATRAQAITVHEPGYAVTQSPLNPQNGMVIDSSGTLYLLDGTGGIRKAGPAGITPWSTVPAYEVALKPTGGAYVTGGICNCIRELRADGTQESSHTYSSGWAFLALAPEGSLYATAPYLGLFRIDRTTFEETPIVLGGPGPGGIGSLHGMATGADGNLYVVGSLSNDISGWRLFRLDGSQLVPVASLPHGGYDLIAGPNGTLFTRTAFDYGSGYPISEVWRVDPTSGTSTKLVSSGSYFHNWNPSFSSFAYDSTKQVLYVQEGGQDTWLIHTIPSSVVTWGAGAVLSVDTTRVVLQWPVEVKVDWLVDIHLERRTENGTFSSVGFNRAMDGQVSFGDDTVVPGTRYAYRAGAEGASGLEYSDVVWVDVPALTPPPPPLQIWSEGSVRVDSSAVTLDWPINPTLVGDVRVERRTPPAAYGSVAAIQLTGDGHVHFVDETVARGTSYLYRAGIPADTGWVWSNELAAQVPAVSPPPPVLVWGDGSVAIGASSVTLEWPINSALAGDVRVERRTSASGFGLIGSIHLVGDGKVQFVDNQVIAGESYAYRAGFPSGGVWDWSEELNADMPQEPGTPTAYSLAFYGGKSSIVRGALDVAFTVPTAGPARIEAYDLSGRRIAIAQVDAPQAGAYSAHLADAGSLRPGMCFLRLVQGASQAQSRAIVIGR